MNLSSKEQTQNLLNRILQDIISQTLSAPGAFGSDWQRELYDKLVEGTAQWHAEREKCRPFIIRMTGKYGADAKEKYSVTDLDATIAGTVILYLDTTKGYFDWLNPTGQTSRSARFVVKNLMESRNGFSHDGKMTLRNNLRHVFLCLSRMRDDLPLLQKKWEEAQFPQNVPEQWFRQMLEIEKLAMRESEDASPILRELAAEKEFAKHLTDELRDWLAAREADKSYPLSCWDESVALAEKAHALFDLPYNCFFYLNRARQDPVEAVDDACFTQEGLERLITTIRPGEDVSVSTLSQHLSHSGAAEVWTAVELAMGRRQSWPAAERNAKINGYPKYAANGFLMVLGACFLLRDQIREAEKRARLDALDRYSLAREIIDARERRDLTFVPLHWETDALADRETAAPANTVETLLELPQPRRLKLFGEAGCGKTTSMEEMAYLEARQFGQNGSGMLPVMVALNALPDSESPLLDALCERLFRLKSGQVPTAEQRSTAEDLLESGGLSLYLDGLNEILDRDRQSRFVSELNSYLRRWPDLSVCLSDRSEQKVLKVMDSARKLFFQPLSLKGIEGYVRTCCRDASVREALIESFAGSERTVERFHTPLQLNYLIHYYTFRQRLPKGPGGSDYVRFLLFRERQKGDRMDGAEEYLGLFAVLCVNLKKYEQNGMSEGSARRLYARLVQNQGLSPRDSRDFLSVLVGMSILAIRQVKDADRERPFYYLEQIETTMDLALDHLGRNDEEDILADLQGFYLTEEERLELQENLKEMIG